MKPEDVTGEMVSAVVRSTGSWLDFTDTRAIIAASVNVVGGSKLRLPRVEMRDLIPGRWYWVADRRIGIGAFIRFKAPPHTPYGREFDSSEDIYGPLPEFELEETT